MSDSPRNGFPISVLDLVTLRSGDPADTAVAQAVARTVDLAQHTEQWGYRRIWFAEHHSIPGIASAATSILIGHIANATRTIRVGSGGIMLPNHAPLVIAEQFGTLASLYPNRIDLGLGRAPGGDWATMRALRRELKQDGDDFPALLAELQGFLGPVRPGQAVRAIPGQNTRVPIYILGSSLYGAQLAARLGLPFAFAAHFAPQALYEAARIYRTTFKPGLLAQPYLMIAAPIIAADTDASANYLATTPMQRFLRLIRNQPVEVVAPIESMDHPAPGYEPWSPLEREAVHARLGAAIVGSDATVQAGLDKLISETGADEIIAVTDLWEHSDRLDSYQRVAAIAQAIQPVTV
ncbi:LLM class flavin-dependent oxidoreductase [Acidicapsa dinghuensis]|uniref:LLM class flavin-dependent oxidoreductase n=1 Tax=Acidicapsa dinghuensis TaxID=2218256 RepID=A0ABW1EFB2_9BACT|nr:LLM class flavin-dependent oxidoreductase [Acidicapsa dinghuensis]